MCVNAPSTQQENHKIPVELLGLFQDALSLSDTLLYTNLSNYSCFSGFFFCFALPSFMQNSFDFCLRFKYGGAHELLNLVPFYCDHEP
jgi:hypothetical protein